MYLSASVLAAALLSSTLAKNSSAHDATAAISGMASRLGADMSLHVPDIPISKRGGSLAPRSPDEPIPTSKADVTAALGLPGSLAQGKGSPGSGAGTVPPVNPAISGSGGAGSPATGDGSSIEDESKDPAPQNQDEEDEDYSDNEFEGEDDARSSGEHFEENAGGNFNKDEIPAPDGTSTPGMSGSATLRKEFSAPVKESLKTGKTSETGETSGPGSGPGKSLETGEVLKPGKSSGSGESSAPGKSGREVSTTFGTGSTTEAGTPTGSGPLAPAVKTGINDMPVVPTTSKNNPEAATTDTPALPESNTTHLSIGTAQLPDTTLRNDVESSVKPGTANATRPSVPPFPTSRPLKPTYDNSTAASTSTRSEAGTNTKGSAKPTGPVQPTVAPVSVSALSIEANVTFPRSLVIVDGAAYFPGLVKGSGYFRVVVDVAASLAFRIERCRRDERNTVVVKAKGEYRYLECSGAECNTVARVDTRGIVSVAPCAGECDVSAFCQRSGQCVDVGHRPALPRPPAAAANSTKVTTDISVSALAQVAVTPQGGVTGLIRAVAEAQASRGGGTVSILAKASVTSPSVSALPASTASGSKPATSAGPEEAPASGSGMTPSDSDKGPAAHEKTAASSHEQAPASAAGGVSPESGSRTAPTGAPTQPNSAAADDTAPQNAPASPYQPPAAPMKATTGAASTSNDGVLPSKPQDQSPGDGRGQAPASALTAAASRHLVGAHLVGAFAALVLVA